MDQEKASNKLIKSLVKTNIYASIFSVFTGLYFDLFVALILFPIYLYIFVSVPFMLEKGYLSRYKKLEEICKKLF